MKSPDDYDKIVQRIEREIRERENGEIASKAGTETGKEAAKEENKIQEVKFYKTVKHDTESKGQLWRAKAVLGLKLFGLAVAAIVAVRVASFVAGVVIVGALVFVSYKLFFENKK